MDDNDFIVDGEYKGYVYVGWAVGMFEPERGGDKLPYWNMYVISPVSDFQSDNFSAMGFKAEKMKCVSSDVWKGLKPGDKVELYFDDRRRVVKVEVNE